MARLVLACAVSISLLASTAFAQEQNKTKTFIETKVTAMKLQGFNL